MVFGELENFKLYKVDLRHSLLILTATIVWNTIKATDVFKPVESSLPLRWPAGGGQLGVASWGWLQSPFFIVCLNQGHFFLSLFSAISMNFF
jgi:hypothetical protein